MVIVGNRMISTEPIYSRVAHCEPELSRITISCEFIIRKMIHIVLYNRKFHIIMIDNYAGAVE